MPAKKRSPCRAPKRTPGQRAGVGADDIVQCARTLAVTDGIDAVSMRRSASELGIAPNAIYTYFDNKTAILDAVLNSVLGEIAVPCLPADRWRDALADILRDSRRALLRHPVLVPLFMSRPGGVHAYRLGQAMLAELSHAGSLGSSADVGMRALLTFTLGSAIVLPASDRDFEAGLAWLLEGMDRGPIVAPLA